MRKLILLLVAVSSLVAATAAELARPAASATTTVTITHTGYKPKSVSVSVGDSVAFTNSDTVAHTVRFKPTTGISCTRPLPLVLPPGQSATCTFRSAGSFNFSDPVVKSKAFRGTVVVGAAPAVSLSATPKVVVYGRSVTLSGALASQQTGQSLQVLAQPCGQASATKVATVTTTTGGAYSFQTKPLKTTTYTVKFKSSTSSAVTVNVRPRMRLGKVAPHRYSLRVFAAQSFAGHYATFQRYRPALRRWVSVKRVLLRANSTGVAPTVVTAARFRSSLRAGLRVRAVLSRTQVGTCYLAGRSNTIRS
ncbi:MAG TPA: cupredoxin domain-containing protein [Thermoleophilaceae bacterium]